MSITNWKIRRWFNPTTGLIAGIILSLEIAYFVTDDNRSAVVSGNHEEQVDVLPPEVKRDPKDVAAPHLAWANDKCMSEVERPLEQVCELFAEARRQTLAFAEEALGWDSKLTIVSDFVQQRSDHSEFLKRKFETLVISEAALASAVEKAIEEYQRAMFSVEGEMLVRLRTDAVDFKNSQLARLADASQLSGLFQNTINHAESAAGFDLQAAVGREIATFIISEVGTQVGVQIGVATGILSSDETTGWTGFLTSMIVGVAVDQMVTAAYDAYADPKGQLASQLNSRLAHMEQLLIDGENGKPGLRARLQQFARERSALRETVVLKLLKSDQGGVL